MKRIIPIAIACSFIITNIAEGQRSYEKSDIENLPTIYWFGVDLSKAFLIEGFNHSYGTQQGYFSGWNTYLLSKDVSLEKLLHKSEVISNLQIVNERNKTFANNAFKISPDTIQTVINQYSYPYPEGIGVVLIVDNFDKPHEKAYAWMTYFDLKSKKVLSTELLMGKTSNGGMVTHWGDALVRIVKVGAIYPEEQY
jgi:hypothetical protein